MAMTPGKVGAMRGEGRSRAGRRGPLAVSLRFVVALAALGCIEPRDQRPGLYVSGEVVSEPVADWVFTDEVREIYVETRGWYLLPHSVTTHCTTVNGKLYVGSLYRGGGEFPDARPWNRNAVRNPRVRLKIGEKVYPLQAVHVTDPAEAQAAFAAIAAKYAQPWGTVFAQPEDQRPRVHFFRMDPRDG
jgi:hypothetical protein